MRSLDRRLLTFGHLCQAFVFVLFELAKMLSTCTAHYSIAGSQHALWHGDVRVFLAANDTFTRMRLRSSRLVLGRVLSFFALVLFDVIVPDVITTRDRLHNLSLIVFVVNRRRWVSRCRRMVLVRVNERADGDRCWTEAKMLAELTTSDGRWTAVCNVETWNDHVRTDVFVIITFTWMHTSEATIGT